jgi:hypothetical protein
MQVDHIEVAPRLWDKTFAVNLKKKERNVEKQDGQEEEIKIGGINSETASVVGAASLSMFGRIKQYLIPGIFIVALFIVIYVIWKYFTKYRKAKAIEEPEVKKPENPNKIHPAKLIASIDDIDKYIVESDDEETKDDDVSSESSDSSEEEDDEPRVQLIEDDPPSFEFKDAIVENDNLFSNVLDDFDSILSHSDELNKLPNIPEDLPMLETDSEEEEEKPQPKPVVRRTRKVVV